MATRSGKCATDHNFCWLLLDVFESSASIVEVGNGAILGTPARFCYGVQRVYALADR